MNCDAPGWRRRRSRRSSTGCSLRSTDGLERESARQHLDWRPAAVGRAVAELAEGVLAPAVHVARDRVAADEAGATRQEREKQSAAHWVRRQRAIEIRRERGRR